MPTAHDSFPRLAARTKNFTLGLPRSFVVSPDGKRVLFLRFASGTSPAQSLWLYDVTSRVERELASIALARLGFDGSVTLVLRESFAVARGADSCKCGKSARGFGTTRAPFWGNDLTA